MDRQDQREKREGRRREKMEVYKKLKRIEFEQLLVKDRLFVKTDRKLLNEAE